MRTNTAELIQLKHSRFEKDGEDLEGTGRNGSTPKWRGGVVIKNILYSHSSVVKHIFCLYHVQSSCFDISNLNTQIIQEVFFFA